MAQPIPLETAARDPAMELQAQLRDAPTEHAEALLGAYEVVQGLHNAGVLDLLRGALGSRDKVLDVAVRATGSPDGIRSIRNLLLLANMLSAINPDVLKTFTQAIPQALDRMIQEPERPGLWSLIKDFLWNPDFRHGLAAVNTMLEVFGRSWSNGGPSNGASAHRDKNAGAHGR